MRHSELLSIALVPINQGSKWTKPEGFDHALNYIVLSYTTLNLNSLIHILISS